MDVPVRIRLGFNGADTQLGRIRLNQRIIDNAAAHFGAYHILEMGRHFDAYVVAWAPPMLHMFAGPHFALRRTGKQKAAVITGSIGETVAGQVFRRKLAVQVANLRHVPPTTRFRTPDYLLDCRVAIPPLIRARLQNGAAGPLLRWPVESKASKTNRLVVQAVSSALQQLASFWYQQSVVNAAIVGYGIIVTLQYEETSEFVVRVIEPSNQANLQTYATTHTLQQFVSGFSQIGSILRGSLRNVP